LAKYAPRLRGFTCYPDGARGGQPLSKVDYYEAKDRLGEEFEENIEYNAICDITGGGHCGI
jgi:ribonucleoside-diphosphate reductase alpha chain